MHKVRTTKQLCRCEKLPTMRFMVRYEIIPSALNVLIPTRFPVHGKEPFRAPRFHFDRYPSTCRYLLPRQHCRPRRQLKLRNPRNSLSRLCHEAGMRGSTRLSGDSYRIRTL